MDDSKLQGPHKTPAPAGRTDFIPMTLVMQPNGLKVELTRPEMLLGRHSGADLRLPMPDVSRRHCRFAYQSNDWQVVDLQSLNGVYVNGERMHEAVLYQGDRLRLGEYVFVIECEAAVVAEDMPKRLAS